MSTGDANAVATREALVDADGRDTGLADPVEERTADLGRVGGS